MTRRQQRAAVGHDAHREEVDGQGVLSRNPLAPARSASKTYSSRSKVVIDGRRAGRGVFVTGNPAGGLDPVHLRHADIHQHDVGVLTSHEGDSFRPIGSFPDNLDIGIGTEEHREATADEGLVVGDRHPDHDDSSGQLRNDLAAAARPWTRLQRATEHRDLLAHPDQAVAPVRRPPVDAASVVGDPRAAAQSVGSPRRRRLAWPGVLEHVGQRLLDDAIRGEVDAGGTRGRSSWRRADDTGPVEFGNEPLEVRRESGPGCSRRVPRHLTEHSEHVANLDAADRLTSRMPGARKLSLGRVGIDDVLADTRLHRDDSIEWATTSWSSRAMRKALVGQCPS